MNDPAPLPGGWTLDAWVVHEQALREADRRFDAERDRRLTEVAVERDQRYCEVDAEREKALRIKDAAESAALTLASENQRLRDEAHNGLLQQWQDERGTYVTNEKFDAVIKPLIESRAAQGGERSASLDARTALYGGLVILVGIIAAVSPHIK